MIYVNRKLTTYLTLEGENGDSSFSLRSPSEESPVIRATNMNKNIRKMWHADFNMKKEKEFAKCQIFQNLRPYMVSL